MGSYQEKRGELCTFIKKEKKGSSSRQGIVDVLTREPRLIRHQAIICIHIITTYKLIGHDYYNDIGIPTLCVLLLSGRDKNKRQQKITNCGCPE